MSKKRKKRIRFIVRSREYKKNIRKDYLISEVCDFFTKFLNNEFEVFNNYGEIVSKLKIKRKKINKNNSGSQKQPAQNISVMYFDGYTEMQSLILSAQIIGVRVILKFCKGEKPHWMRVPVWRKGLEIAEYFEKRGLISEKKICYFTRDGYVFRCRVYDVDGLGEIILPEHAFDLSFPTEIHGDYDGPPLWNPPMPPLMEHTGGVLKKYAAKIIEGFSFENEIENM